MRPLRIRLRQFLLHLESTSMRLQAYGDQGVLLGDLTDAERSAWISRFEATLPDGCSEFVLGYNSILLVGAPEPLATWVDDAMSDLQVSIADATIQPKPVIRVPVNYSGPDLHSVAEAAGLTDSEVVKIHSDPIYTVRMIGFSPGFPYLDGLDLRLHLPRRPDPRMHIEPGSVAIGGPHAGIYSIASPGGWHLLGQTGFVLFDKSCAKTIHSPQGSRQVFRLAPEDRVQFYPI